MGDVIYMPGVAPSDGPPLRVFPRGSSPAEIRLDAALTPLLIYAPAHPEGGAGWVLVRATLASGLTDHFLGGDEDAVEVARERALALLASLDAGGGGAA